MRIAHSDLRREGTDAHLMLAEESWQLVDERRVALLRLHQHKLPVASDGLADHPGQSDTQARPSDATTPYVARSKRLVAPYAIP
jgi:hypothetical protein